MTRYQALKPALRRAFATVLLPEGWRNPGVNMWRRRDPLVDVLHVRSRYGVDVAIWCGCSLRAPRPQPLPWTCIFQTLLLSSLDIPENDLDSFAIGIAQQVELLSHQWLQQLASVDAAHARAEAADPRFVAFGKGSPAYDDAVSALRAHRTVAAVK